MAYSNLRIDRDKMKRDVDSDDDSEWLDDPVAKGLQPMNAAAGAMNAASGLPNIERPDHVSPETHHLVLKTMLGGEGWRERKDADDALVALRYQRMAELRRRAAAGGADGFAAQLVARELADLDGERLTRELSTAKANDCLVVHVHAPSARGAAVLDAALATLAGRHAEVKRRREGGGRSTGGGRATEVRPMAGEGDLQFARLSAVDAGVTARLDVVDESALPALLLYRGGRLVQSTLNVALPSVRTRLQPPDDDGPSSGGGGGSSSSDRVIDSDDLDALADEVEDLLDDLGLYE
jgi:hypothetical protein